MNTDKKKQIEKRKQAAVANLEENGLLPRIARTMAAAYMLQQMANTLFYDTQDALEERGFFHGELKRIWRNAETANDRLARKFAGDFMTPGNVDSLVEDVERCFPPILRVLHLEEDIARITGRPAPQGPAELHPRLAAPSSPCRITFPTDTALRSVLADMAKSEGITQGEMLSRAFRSLCKQWLERVEEERK